MQKIFTIITAFLLLMQISQSDSVSDNDVYSQSGSFELGGALGTASGIDARYWFTERIGIEGVMGLSSGLGMSFSADIFWENYPFFYFSLGGLRLYYGLGTSIVKDDDTIEKKIRIPIGVSLPLRQYPANISCFLAPAAYYDSDKDFGLDWGISIRFDFGRADAGNARQASYERQVAELTGEVDTLKRSLGKTSEKLGATEGELGSTKGKLNKTQEELSSTKGKLGQTEEELSSTKGRLAETSDELNYTKNKLGLIQKRMDKVEGDLTRTKDKLSYTQSELDNSKNQLDIIKSELSTTKRTLDDKQTELAKKQTELDNAKDIISNALTGKEKEEETKKIAVKQTELNKQVDELKENRKSWEKIKKEEVKKRELLIKNCEERGGIINDDGYCTCPDNEEWNPKTEKCECVKGSKRNQRTGDCDTCEIITYNGECTEGCNDDEEKIAMKKGPHKFVCVKKCRGKNEVWSKKKKECVCKEGYYRDDSGECVPRR